MVLFNLILTALLLQTTAYGNWISPKLEDAIKKQALAYAELNRFHDTMRADVKTSYGGNVTYTRYTYWGTAEALAARRLQCKSFEKFANTFALTIFGDGFLCGMVLACVAKSLKVPITSPKAMIPTFAILSALAAKQSNKIGSVPYFDDMLWKTASNDRWPRLIAHILGLAIGCAAGAYSTNFALDRLSNIGSDSTAESDTQ